MYGWKFLIYREEQLNTLQNVITYVRRIIKTPSDATITDNLIIDYINRFWIMDVDARMQLFDLKTKYQFLTTPGVDQYNMPLYDLQIEPGAQSIASYPVYQGFLPPVFIDGIQVPFYTLRSEFNNLWPNYTQYQQQVGIGDGTNGPYTLTLQFLTGNTSPPLPFSLPLSACIIRGHVDITGIIASGANIDPPIGATDGSTIPLIPTTSVYSAVYFTSTGADGTNIVIADSGQFLEENQNYGLLMEPGNAPFGNTGLTGTPLPYYSTTQNTINYFSGVAQNVYFPAPIPTGMPINAQCYYYQLGLPRSCLFFNNIITLRAPPNTQYVVELDAYLSPAAFLSSSQALPYAYMSEYIARGAARKILSDTGDTEQFVFYEPLFREQELLVWKRSQRQWTSTRTQTIYSGGGLSGGVGSIGNGIGIN